MNIWIVEDDDLQMELLTGNLRKEVHDVHLTEINTEYEFRQQLANLTQPYPNLVMLDIMLRWTDPSPDMQQPPENVKNGGYYRAGFRCERLIRNNPLIKDIPIFLYTVLSEFDIEEDMKSVSSKTRYVGKNADDGLLSSIKSLCSLQHRQS